MLSDEALVPETLMTLSVYIDGQLVFGPVTPPPMQESAAQNYSFFYILPSTNSLVGSEAQAPGLCPLVSDPTSHGINLTILVEPAAYSGFWSLLIGAIELTPSSTNVQRTTIQLTGTSIAHQNLSGKYILTDLMHEGRPVYLHSLAPALESEEVVYSQPYSYILYDGWSGVLMAISRTAREQLLPPELFQPLGSAADQEVLVSAAAAAWLEQVGISSIILLKSLLLLLC